MKKLGVSCVMLILLLVATLALVSIAEAATWSSPSMIAEDCFHGKASISGDGSKIAFEGWDGNDNEIFVINSDGTGLTQLTNNTKSDRDPSISGDGSKIAFSRDLEGCSKHQSPEIFVINSDGTGLTQLTDSPEIDYCVRSSNPSISGDGSKIAFQRMNFKTWDRGIFVINSDGTGEKMLTNNTHFDEGPSISDDGIKIAFSGGDDFDWQIFVINSDGSGLTQLTNNKDNYQYGAPMGGPSISGDGSKVAFGGLDGSDWEFFVVISDGSGLKQLTDNSYKQEENMPPPFGPSISGDGSKIVFSNFVESGLENPSVEIFVINSDGTGLTQLTNTTKWNSGPSICDNGERIAFRGCF
ncbi:MAG: TolB family protein, partial [Candidatus Ranarchaeia archaeon]